MAEAPEGYVHVTKSGKTMQKRGGKWVEIVDIPQEVEPYKPKAFEPEQPGWDARIGRGFADTIQGVAQLGTRLTPDAIGQYVDPAILGASNFLTGGNATNTADFEREKNAELAIFEQGNKAAQDNFLGIDPYRLVGNVASTAPLAAATPATLGGAAALGAGAAATQYTPAEDTTDFLFGKAGQVGAGAAGGAAGYGIAQLIGKAAPPVYRLLSQNSPSSANKIQAELLAALRKQGLGPDDLDGETLSRFLNDAANQMDQYGDLDADALLRAARFQRLGLVDDARPTRAQITRDPTAWTEESNAAKLLNQKGMPNPIQERQRAIDQVLFDRIDDVRGIGAPSDDVGSSVIDTVQSIGQKTQQQVSAAYRAAENAPGAGQTIAAPERFVNDLVETYSTFDETIPPGVRKQLLSFTDGGNSLTVDNVSKFWRTINAQGMPGGSEGAALNQLRYATRAAIDRTARSGGENAKALREASLAAARRFGWIRGPANRPTRLIQDVIDGKVDSKAMANRLLNSSPEQMDHLRRFLTDFAPEGVDGRTAWEQVRRHVSQNLAGKMTGGMDERSWINFNGRNFAKAWRDLGPRRNILFNAEEFQLIDDLSRAVLDIQAVPRGATVNFSNTTPALFNILSRMNQVPGLRYLASTVSGALRFGDDFLEGVDASRAAQRAVSPILAPRGQQATTKAVAPYAVDTAAMLLNEAGR